LVVVFWREEWLKPLSDFEIGSEICKFCEKRFENIDFVTSCEFCEIGVIHSRCADDHILNDHKQEIMNKIQSQRDRRLHDYQWRCDSIFIPRRWNCRWWQQTRTRRPRLLVCICILY